MRDGEKDEAEELDVPSEHDSSVGDEAVVVDVQRHPDDGDASNANCKYQ